MIKKILPSIIMVLSLVLLSANANAQLNYTVSFPTATYTAVTGTNPVLTLAYPPSTAATDGTTDTDEGAANGIPLPFPFKFNGVTYNTCNISTDGFISFGAALDTLDGYYLNNLNSGPYNGAANDGRASRPIIAALWDDLDIQAATNITYTTIGTAPNRIFAVQWSNALWTYSATSASVNFQIKLYEADNRIRFHYKPINAGTLSTVASASVGLADGPIGSGNFLSLSALTTTATNSGNVETNNIKLKPSANLVIDFTPVPIPSIDAGVTLIGAPITATCLATTQSFTYVIKNSGTTTIAPGAASINMTLTGLNTGSYSGSNTKSIAFGSYDTITISGVNLNTAGSTLVTGLIGLTGDTRATNDTSKYTYTTAAIKSAFPISDPSTTPSTLFKYRRTVLGGTQLWSLFSSSSLAVPNNANPLSPHGSADTTYWVFLGRYSGINSLGYVSRLYSDCMDIPAGMPSSNYNLKFYMTNDSAAVNSPDSLFVTVSTNKGASWQTIGSYSRVNGALTAFTWVEKNIDLSAFAGQTIQIAFEGQSELGNLFAVDDITVTANFPLPIKLSTFTGTREGTKNILHWTTASETNNKGFELQRSANGKEFSAITFVSSKAINGSSSAIINYNYNDEKPLAGTNYYRLRQLDNDGKESLSAVVILKSAQITKAEISRVYPNPVQDKLNIVLNTPSSEKVNISITDLAGKIISTKTIETVSGDNNIQFNTAKLAKGTYFIKVNSSSNSELATQKFVK